MPVHEWIGPERSPPRDRAYRERFPFGAEERVGSPRPPERASGHHVVQHVSFGEWEPSSLGFLRALTGKQYRRCGVLRKRA